MKLDVRTPRPIRHGILYLDVTYTYVHVYAYVYAFDNYNYYLR